MEIVEYLINNWTAITAILAVVVVFGGGVFAFVKSPRVVKAKRFRTWLLYVVTEAEREMGKDTGELKLLKAYEEFVKRFPIFSLLISFDSFKLTVDESLKQMKQMLEENEAIECYVKQVEAELIECAMCGVMTEDLEEHNGEVLCEVCYENSKEEDIYG